MWCWLKNRWRGEGGYRELLQMALPLVVSMGITSLQLFVDRVFLGWYSGKTMAASMQAGIAAFTIIVLFTSTAAYCNTFVAQYVGARRPDRVGLAVWQGAFFALGAWVVFLIASVFAGPLLDLVGHEAGLRVHEVTYFRIVLGGAGISVLSAALSSFFTGRGDTITVMLVTSLSVVINVGLNYLWIFGHAGFPEMGIAGAAWATVVANAVGACLFMLLMLRRRHRERFATASGFRFDRNLFVRLMRFGFPAGLTGMLDVLVWTIFLSLIGRVTTTGLIATAAAFSINQLAFMPMFGIGVSLSTLVGRRQGEYRPDVAARTVWSGIHLVTVYMVTIAACYVLVPRLFLALLAVNADPEEFRTYASTTIVLLRYVALYTVFDGFTITFISALRGAGDTRFPLIAATAVSYGLVVVPNWILYATGHATLYRFWTFTTACVIALSFVMLFRFLGGKWRSMRVIEEEVPPPYIAPHPDVPPLDIE
ncbi:MAG: MATE family efflux transporter [Verrucomicrobia bacterium]|nr:MATE family efflux transporter [Verrucomicrobiota bacterium]